MVPSQEERFGESVVIITGSTRGIGEAVARRFATEGASVVVTGRTQSAGEVVVADINEGDGEAIFVQANLRDPDQIAALVETTVERYGSIDILVNNAAVQTATGANEATLDDWNVVLETDFRSYWLCAKHSVKHMNRGSIINISSNHAYLTMPGLFPYNAVKAGINGMTRAMALDFGPEIRVNTINPGWVGVDRTLSELGDDELAHLESIHPVGRIGDPEDIAGVAAFLASEDAAFVTGASILADGGRTAVMQDNTLPDYRRKE